MSDGKEETETYVLVLQKVLVSCIRIGVIVFLIWTVIYLLNKRNNVLVNQNNNVVELREPTEVSSEIGQIEEEFLRIKSSISVTTDSCRVIYNHDWLQSLSDYAQVVAPNTPLADDLLRESKASLVKTRSLIRSEIALKKFDGCDDAASGAIIIQKLWGVVIPDNPLYDPILREEYRKFRKEEIRLLLIEEKAFPELKDLEDYIESVVLESTNEWRFTYEEIGAPRK